MLALWADGVKSRPRLGDACLVSWRVAFPVCSLIWGVSGPRWLCGRMALRNEGSADGVAQMTRCVTAIMCVRVARKLWQARRTDSRDRCPADVAEERRALGAGNARREKREHGNRPSGALRWLVGDASVPGALAFSPGSPGIAL